MRLAISSETRWVEIERRFCCVITVRMGDQALSICGVGPVADAAEHEAARAFARLGDDAEQLGDIRARAGRVNWWAAEHSKEGG